MDGDNISKTTEGIEKTGWGIIKWAIISIVSLSILSGVFWALFYSVYLANFEFIVPLRIRYQDTFWKAEGLFLTKNPIKPPFDPVYEIQVQSAKSGNGESLFFYSAWGKVSKIDLNNSVVTLTGFDNKTYIFKIDKSRAENVNDAYLATGGHLTIQVFWMDKTLMRQLIKDYNDNPTQMLNDGAIYTFVNIYIK